jgi:hypothetical protein
MHAITFSFSTTSGLLMLYFMSARSRLQYASVAWNTLTSTDASKLEHIQRKLLALSHNRFFPPVHYSYVSALDHLNFYSLCSRRDHSNMRFVVIVYNGFKF